MNTDLYYQESGTVDKPRLLAGILVLLAVVAVLGYCYGLLMSFIPLIYFNVLIAIGFGMVLGMAVRLIDRFSNSRNIKTNYLLAGIAIVAAVLFTWSYFLNDVVSESMPSFGGYLLGPLNALLSPVETFKLIGLINQIGTWGLSEFPVTGIFLAVVWIAEILIIGFLTFSTAIDKFVAPFSEKENKWFPKYTIDNDFESVPAPATIEPALVEDPLKALESLAPGTGWRHSKVHLFYLPEADHQYLSIERVYIEDQGKGSKNREAVINNFRLTGAQATAIMERFNTTKEKVDVI